MRKSSICLLLALVSSYAQSAFAAGPSAAVLVGNGFKDGYNIGFGARGGFTLPMNVHVGGTLIYHLGKTETTPIGDVTTRLLYVGGEGGYDINAGPLTVRPYFGVGYVSLSTMEEGLFAFWPGAVAMFPIGSLFVGVDARYVLLTDVDAAISTRGSRSIDAFSLFATLGLKWGA